LFKKQRQSSNEAFKNIKGDAVDTNRRDALKLGASAAMSGMFISNAIAAPDARQPIVVEPLTGKAGFRIANYLPKMGATSRLGLVTNDGLVVDIPAEAARQKVQLSFDPTSTISYIKVADLICRTLIKSFCYRQFQNHKAIFTVWAGII
jgi:uncharacterized phosphosugar-binding protein